LNNRNQTTTIKIMIEKKESYGKKKVGLGLYSEMNKTRPRLTWKRRFGLLFRRFSLSKL
jgi:hypothetical protein